MIANTENLGLGGLTTTLRSPRQTQGNPVSEFKSRSTPDHWLTLGISGGVPVINMHARSRYGALPVGPPVRKPISRRPPGHWLTLGGSGAHPIINMHSSSQGAGLPVGMLAPDFTIRGTPDHWLTLSEFLGGPVILAFQPENGSKVGDDQMALLNEMLPKFQKFGATLFGISMDFAPGRPGHANEDKLRFPLLADCAPKGGIARSYGVYRENEGDCASALFIINAEGRIHWSHVSPDGAFAGAAGILAALESLSDLNAVAA
jgi:peroxiredoxin